MKQSDIDRSMAERNPLSNRAGPVKPVDPYSTPDGKRDGGDKATPARGPVPAQSDIQDYAQQYRREEDTKQVVSIKMRPERRAQVKREAQSTGLYEWQVIDIALEMYFRAKK
jgi:hypothetical protein